MRKITKIIICLAFILTVAAIPLKVQAAQEPYMKQLNISWDLEPEKTVTFQTYYYGVGFKDHKATVQNFKIEDAEEKGYKKLSFTTMFETDPYFTDEEFKKFEYESKQYGKKFMISHFSVVDYQTGENLQCTNNKNVTVEITDTELGEKKRYERPDFFFEYYEFNKSSMSITYPKDYHDLCIVLGGSAADNHTENNEKFISGECMFGETSYISSNKEISHAMRIADLSVSADEIELEKNPELLLVGQKMYISLKDWAEHEEWKIINAESSNENTIKTSASYSEMEGMGSSAELDGLKEGTATVAITAKSFTSNEEKVFTCNIKVEKETAKLDRMRFNVKNSKNGVIIYGVTAVDKNGKKYKLNNINIDVKNKKISSNKFEITKKYFSDIDNMERSKMSNMNVKKAEKYIPLIFTFSHGNSRYTTGLARIYLDKKGKVVGKFDNVAVANEAF